MCGKEPHMSISDNAFKGVFVSVIIFALVVLGALFYKASPESLASLGVPTKAVASMQHAPEANVPPPAIIAIPGPRTLKNGRRAMPAGNRDTVNTLLRNNEYYVLRDGSIVYVLGIAKFSILGGLTHAFASCKECRGKDVSGLTTGTKLCNASFADGTDINICLSVPRDMVVDSS